MVFLLKRLLQGVFVAFLVASLSFVLIQLAPGDPFAMRDSVPGALTADLIERNQRQFGTDQPIAVQYGLYFKNLLSGNFGISYLRGGRPILPDIIAAAGRTVVLGAAALIINFGLGIAVGTWQALRYPSTFDRMLTLVALVVYSLPVFWLGFVFVFLFVEQFRLFPIGWGGSIRHLVLPSLTLGLIGAAATSRFHRDAMLNARQAAFVRTARSKGLPEVDVVMRHIFRNALNPAITLLGLSLPILLSGSVFVERVFQWHGIGSLAVDAVANREYHLATSITLIVAVMVVLSNLVADLLHRALDPRARASQ